MRPGFRSGLIHIGIPVLIGLLLTLLILFLTRFQSPSNFGWHLLLFICVAVTLIWAVFYLVATRGLGGKNKPYVMVGRFFVAIILGILIFDLLYAVIKWIDVNWFNSIDYLTVGHLVAASGLGFFAVLIVGGIQTAIYMTNHWVRDKVAHATMEKEFNQMQLHLLRQQLDPHFVFNSFSTLDGLIHRDQEKASQFLHDLSSFYGLVLKTYDRDLVLLSEELEIVKHYVELLKLRFEKALTVIIQIDAEVYNLRVPPLSIQTLIENVIKHNAISNEHELKVDVRQEGNMLVIRNNKQLKSVIENSSQIGLSNLKKRFKLYGKELFVRETKDDFVVKFELIK